MNTLSRTITGILAISLGLFLTMIGFTLHFMLLYGIPIIIIGILILFNKKEDNIEKTQTKAMEVKNKMANMIVTTGNEIPGNKIINILGVVKGSTVRARNIGRDIGAGFKSIIGGEIKTYTEMTQNSRDEAYNRMVNDALNLNADAIIGVRFTTSMVMAGASEMLAYGTAVKISEEY